MDSCLAILVPYALACSALLFILAHLLTGGNWTFEVIAAHNGWNPADKARCCRNAAVAYLIIGMGLGAYVLLRLEAARCIEWIRARLQRRRSAAAAVRAPLLPTGRGSGRRGRHRRRLSAAADDSSDDHARDDDYDDDDGSRGPAGSYHGDYDSHHGGLFFSGGGGGGNGPRVSGGAVDSAEDYSSSPNPAAGSPLALGAMEMVAVVPARNSGGAATQQQQRWLVSPAREAGSGGGPGVAVLLVDRDVPVTPPPPDRDGSGFGSDPDGRAVLEEQRRARHRAFIASDLFGTGTAAATTATTPTIASPSAGGGLLPRRRGGTASARKEFMSVSSPTEAAASGGEGGVASGHWSDASQSPSSRASPTAGSPTSAVGGRNIIDSLFQGT